ncbi:MAG: hypothetical protein Q9163_006513, partial [Psora crenata]
TWAVSSRKRKKKVRQGRGRIIFADRGVVVVEMEENGKKQGEWYRKRGDRRIGRPETRKKEDENPMGPRAWASSPEW